MKSFERLLEQYLDGTLSAEELELFLVAAREASNQVVTEQVIQLKLEQQAYTGLAGSGWNDLLFESMLQRAVDMERPAKRIFRISRWTWAAAIAILLAGTLFIMLPGRKVETVASDIAPGREGAILTLSDGTQIVLDSMPHGLIAQQQGSVVVLGEGGLAYETSGKAGAQVAYNTMTTPKGRQFQLTLPDGTKVWLNAASTIRYPTLFSEKERLVTISGEAYFEVRGNTRQPFRISIDGKAEVEVLGTRFNINAYGNEKSINATLLDGRIRVRKGQEQVMLQPGQQGQVTEHIRVTGNVNLEKVVAWKNGVFNFEGAGLDEVMRQLERWYDIRVRYDGAVPDITFSGEMYRSVNLSDILEVLQKMGIHFRLEGRTLTIKV